MLRFQIEHDIRNQACKIGILGSVLIETELLFVRLNKESVDESVNKLDVIVFFLLYWEGAE